MTDPGLARYAVYYAPTPNDPLFAEGAAWLGRDPESGAPVPQPEIAGISEIAAEPAHYGLHATLKPPMRLAPGTTWAELADATREIASGVAPFDLPSLIVADLLGFLALREITPSMPLQALADLCMAALDRFRAQPTEAELERRRRAGLSLAEAAMLGRFGYPYAFGAWFFHMTLTRRLSAEEKARFMPLVERHFAPALLLPRRVTDICLFCQREPAAAFVIAERFPLRG